MLDMQMDFLKKQKYGEALALQNDINSIFEPGCGLGKLAKLAKQKFNSASVFGLDLNPTAIQIAQERYPDITFEVGNIMEYKTKNIYDLAVFELFDAGLIGEGLLHLLPKIRQHAKQLLPMSAQVYAQLV